MTISCKERGVDLNDGIEKMIGAMVEDYVDWTGNTSLTEERAKERAEEFANKFEITEGRKYIKVISDRSVTAFVMKEDDNKFRKGDILKPAGWNAPARNAARGNVLEGNYPINWTGPLYL
jgi:hypothetical protein